MLLAGDMTVRFDVVDLTGNPVDFMVIGNDYDLQAYVQDTRTTPTGVSRAYFDVAFDSTIIAPRGGVQAGPEYAQDAAGDTLTTGLLDEAGGTDTNDSPPLPPDVELLLFQVPITAQAAGNLDLRASLSQLSSRLPLFFQHATPIQLADIDFTGSIQEVRDPGILVSPSTGLQTTEGGGSDKFDIVLYTTPTANVTVTLSSSDTSEGTPSPSTVTFTPANWNVSQEVTIFGVDDFLADGNVDYQIITGSATSDDPIYAGFDPDNVSVTNFDNDFVGVTVFPTTGQTTESGGTDTFEIVLTSQPTADVTVNLSSSDTSEGTIDRDTITLTPSTWNIPQTVTIRGQDDNITDGNQAYSILTSTRSAMTRPTAAELWRMYR